MLARVLDGLERQGGEAGRFEAIVVDDPWEDEPGAVAAAVGRRPYPVRRLSRHASGVSAARNRGWRDARAPLVLFLGDDILPSPELVREHLDWHDRNPPEEIGVLGHVTWSRELRVTPFMRWLDRGMQFDYGGIQGAEAGWGRLYTANASLKRSLIERVGGFDEGFPFGYEDLDLAYRMHRAAGLRLLYNDRARAEHHHAPTLEEWRRRMASVASAERRFVEKHPEVDAYFHSLLSDAAAAPPASGRGARLAALVPERVPWLGPRVWSSADLSWRQALARPFLEVWASAGAQAAPSGPPEAIPSGADPSGPK